MKVNKKILCLALPLLLTGCTEREKIDLWNKTGWLYDGEIICRVDEVILVRDVNEEKIEVTLRGGQTLKLNMSMESALIQMEERYR